jgi:lysophospholipase L1-like esterase
MSGANRARKGRRGGTGKEITLWLVSLLLVLMLLEVAIRVAYAARNALVDVMPLPYAIGADWGPIPPWLDQKRMLEENHPTLVWRGSPHFRQTYLDVFGPAATDDERRSILRSFSPLGRAVAEGGAVWTMALNSEGFRERELPEGKTAATFRIVCLGDSWTAGSNVDERDTFPRRLEALLAERFPQGSFEVLNLGVFGYASYNGLRLAQRAMALQPDVVIVGFAMNEPSMAGYRPIEGEAVGPGLRELPAVIGRTLAGFVMAHSEVYRLLDYWAKLLTWQPKSIGDHLLGQVDTMHWYDTMDEQASEDWMQVSVADYRRHIEGMMAAAQAFGAQPILLYPEFWLGGPYLRTLLEISEQEDVPVVDASRLIEAATRQRREALQQRLGLLSAGLHPGQSPGEVEVVLRVHQGTVEVSRALYIAGTHPGLGDVAPNRVALNDAGDGADERADDGVWSYAFQVEPGSTLHYVYTNSGRDGEWEGLDLPVLRRLSVPAGAAGSRLLAPIETFGELEFHADPWHTDARGNGLIARELLREIERTEQFKIYMERSG